MKRLPTLITYRSAMVMREEAIQFAYRKMGQYVSMLVGSMSMAAGAWLILTGASNALLWSLLVVSLASSIAATYCGRTMSFPHCPRLSFEELDAMRDDMGLPAEVIHQTRDSVVLGSEEDWKAARQAEAVVAKIQRIAKSPNGVA